MTGRFRVRCPKCGNVTDINGNVPCHKCGNPLALAGAEIKLYRMGSPLGVAIGFGVYIDGQPCGHIANKETVSYSVPFGTHTVHMTAGMSRKCVDMTVTLTPQAPIGYLKAHIKPGFISNTVVIESALPQDMPV